MTDIHYRPSGRVSPAAIPVVLLCMLATLPGAWLYAWLMANVPLLIKVFFPLGYALLLGCIAMVAAGRGKVRNPNRMAYMGLVIGFAGWYFQWAAWLALHVPADFSSMAVFLDTVTHPATVADALGRLLHIGTWGIGGERITGFLLGALWLVEFALFLALPAMLGHDRALEPFDETSNTWARKTDIPGKFAHTGEREAVAAFLESHPGEVLSLLTPWREAESPSHATVTMYRGGGQDVYLTITNVTVRMVDGKLKKSHSPVVIYIHLPGVDHDTLVQELTAIAAAGQQVEGTDSAPVSEELAKALEHLHAERHEAVLIEASPYVKSAQAPLRTDANRLCALASSRLERWDDACGYWEALFADEASAHNALQIASSAVMAGDLDRGKSWFERAHAMNDAAHDMPSIAIDTNFVTALTNSGNARQALPYLDRIKSLYIALGITDPTFLFMRQVPQFDVFLDNSVPVVEASLGAEERRQWYESMLPHLDDRGKDELTAWLGMQLQAG